MDSQLIERAKQGDLEAALQIFNEHRDYIHFLERSVFYVPLQNYDDFEQLAFLAVIETVKVYKIAYSDRSTFKALWRKYILKEYFDFKLETQFSMRVSRSTYSKINASIGVYNSILQPINYELDIVKGSNLFLELEKKLLNETLWQIVEETLSYKDYLIILNHFKYEKTLNQIAKEFSVSSEAIRKRKNKSIEKLKVNKYMQLLAEDYYGLQREM